jgi:hypothetical protein
MRIPYRRGPGLPKGGKFGVGRTNASRRASWPQQTPSSDCFDWVPERELVVGPPRKRPGHFIAWPSA